MEHGHIYIHRKIIDWKWYDDVNTRLLFIHLLITANYEDYDWHGIVVKRGQRLTSIRKLASDVGISVQSLRTSITKLKSTHEITYESTHQYILITIINYNTYQSVKNFTNTVKNKASNTTLTHDQHTTNTNLIRNKEIEEINTYARNDHFDEFWNAYGKKISRDKCEGWYRKNASNGTHAEIMEGIKRWKASGQWDDPQYQPYPYTFLFNHRWEDEPPRRMTKEDIAREEATQRFLKGEKL